MSRKKLRLRRGKMPIRLSWKPSEASSKEMDRLVAAAKQARREKPKNSESGKILQIDPLR